MCFSVSVNLVKEEIEQRFGVDFPSKYRYEPSYYYHAFSMPVIPAILSGKPGEVTMAKWGLIPAWVKSKADADEIRTKTFNARSESVDEKPSFSTSFRETRCIIPVSGFFEWQHDGKNKIPWYIYNSEGGIMCLAGLYSDWIVPETGEIITTFSIVTTEANELMARIHNSGKRMPVILNINDEKKWLNAVADEADLKVLMKPFPQELMKAHTIGSLINDKRADKNTPDLLKPYEYHTPGLLF